MTEQPRPINTVAPLQNVASLVELIARVKSRGYGLPGLATFYGRSGDGKSTAALYAANRFRAYQVQVKSTWTAKKLCEAILLDLAIPPARNTADMVDQISEQVAISERPLIIDEADFLVSRNMIEVVRDIYESSGATIILIGEELLPQKLQRWERVHGRMLDWVGTQPASLADVTELAKIYAPGIRLDDDIKAHILKVSHASIRRISVSLDRVREFARTRNTRQVEKADLPKIDFFTGTAPLPRKF